MLTAKEGRSRSRGSVDGPQHDAMPADFGNQRLRRHHALRGLHGDRQQLMRQRAVLVEIQRSQSEPSDDGGGVLQGDLVALGVQRPGQGRCVELGSHHRQDRRIWFLVARDRPAGEARLGDLRGQAQAVAHAAVDFDECVIGLRPRRRARSTWPRRRGSSAIARAGQG